MFCLWLLRLMEGLKYTNILGSSQLQLHILPVLTKDAQTYSQQKMDREQENFAHLYPRYCRNRNLEDLKSLCWPVPFSNIAIMKNRICTVITVLITAQNTDSLLLVLLHSLYYSQS